jgi:hypothetical protein
MSEHFWGSNKGFEILANSVQNPVLMLEGGGGRRQRTEVAGGEQ